MPAIVCEVVELMSKINEEYILPQLYRATKIRGPRKIDVVRQFCKEQLNLENPVFFRPKYSPLPGATVDNCHSNVLRGDGIPQHCWMIVLSPYYEMFRDTENVQATFHSVLRRTDGTYQEATPLENPVHFYVLEERFDHEWEKKE